MKYIKSSCSLVAQRWLFYTISFCFFVSWINISWGFANDTSDISNAIKLVGGQDAIIVVGEEVPTSIKEAADALARASGQPLENDVAFIHRGDRRWAFNGWYSGKTLVAVGTPADNTLVAELIHTDKSQPEPFWGSETLPSSTIRYFAPGQLKAKPWLGAPFVAITGEDAGEVADAARQLARKLVGTAPPTSGLNAWFEHVAVSTHPNESTRQNEKRNYQVTAARGEQIWFKCVIRLDKKNGDVEIMLPPLEGPMTLPGFTLYELKRRVVREDGVGLDDVMVPVEVVERRVSLDGLVNGQSTSYLVEYVVPREAKAGTYQTILEIKTKENTLKLPVRFQVLDFAVPQQMPLPVFFYGSISPPLIREFFGAKTEAEYVQALDSVAEQIKKFGANVGPRIEYSDTVRWVMVGNNGQYRIDYQEFDQLMEWLQAEKIKPPYIIGVRLDRPRRTRLFDTIGRSGIYDQQGVHHVLRTDRGENGPQVPLKWRNKAIRAVPWLEDLKQHLDEKGWTEHVRIYAGDEPRDLDEYVESIQPLLKVGLKPITSINKVRPPEGLNKLIGILDPFIFLYHPWERHGDAAMHDVWQDFAVERRKKGEDVWWYHCLGLVARGKDFAWARRFAWHSWEYDIDGMAFWSPLSISTIGYLEYRSVKKGEREQVRQLHEISWDDYPNSAMAFYDSPDKPSLLGSRRMAIVAQSFEDYKYLWVFDQWVDRLPTDSEVAQQAIAVRNAAYAKATNDIGLHSHFTDARQQIAEQIVLMKNAVLENENGISPKD